MSCRSLKILKLLWTLTHICNFLFAETQLSDSEPENGANVGNGRKELSTKNQAFNKSLTQCGDHSSSSSSDEDFTTVLTKKPLSNSKMKQLSESSEEESSNEILSQHKEYESESAQVSSTNCFYDE